ncbi:Uma3 [Pseudomonas saudimassiliensis]|uniref:Uma3 n=1 Tax=Pseudomonas saudimassiliensis TaxID=1461581 RepID=A0A078MKP9_9PSED|nr:bifunctional aminoglycoside phosphotransferase/ATP-binding protein [Pseudomonas saudimassiliensis]CEA06855.1 Uma3 [Pseudomonas saudimassiliensis]CEF28120.1 Uma3 [Pseudomonas saudimassiliensis]
MSQTLLTALQNPALYDHPVTGFTLMETHISWVILTGDFVYKIKKPVNFGFLDFSTLEKRAHFCAEELRLNRRLAPDLYLDVIAIRGSEDAPRLDGDGPAIEYMVKTRQFRQQDLLGNMQRAGQLAPEHIDSLAATLATFHGQIERAPIESAWGQPDQVHAPVAQNFEQIRPLLNEPADLAQLEQLEQWAHTTFQRLIPQLAQRKAEGLVRECHGDIYLDNVTLVAGQVTLFDCIEFNDAFRWIDVMSDVAFMAMDLEDRGLRDLSQRFVNGWLEHTGDYAGLAVLNYYKAYRAMVRAKIALFNLGPDTSDQQRADIMARYRGYAALAESYTHIPHRFGLLTHGVSGSGKSTLAQQLVSRLGVVRLRSDVERKRLFGRDTSADQRSELYSAELSQRTYTHLAALATQILAAGYPVVVDATHLHQAQRQQVRQAIEDQGAPCLILHCRASLDTIEIWLNERQRKGSDPSDADIHVVRHQLEHLEALDDEEQLITLTVDTERRDSIDQLTEQLRARLGPAG